MMGATPHTVDHQRRALLRRATQLAAAGSALPFALNLAAVGEAAAFSATDYKALVCIFLFGGNDQSNTVVPYDEASYARYQRIRGVSATGLPNGIALARSSLAATELRPSTAPSDGLRYALHPQLGPLASLFHAGKAAVLLNVGPLRMPISRAQYDGGDRVRFPIPPQLFSHNDQQSVWQSGGAEGSVAGWGGLAGDLALQGNGQSMFTCISITGNHVFLNGRDAIQYQCTSEGAIPVFPIHLKENRFGWPDDQVQAFREMITRPSGQLLENEYSRVMARALQAYDKIDDAMSRVPELPPFPGGSDLATQLQGVARLIAGRESLGVKRQVFMVSAQGYDLHDRLLDFQPGQLQRLGQAIQAFHAATQALGVDSQVTTFTASDFGRALSSNGNGSDHGWGGHHFIVGGAVKGKAFYGTPPPVSVGNSSAPEDQWHVGQGRLLPSTSVDQYGATLARWFGVSNSELNGLFPSLAQFGGQAHGVSYPQDLGFL